VKNDGREKRNMPDGPLILGWDTSTENGALFLGVPGVLLEEKNFHTEKGHTSWLMPLIDSMLKRAQVDPWCVDAIAVGIGPGNFTGLKVGVSTAKAVAMALDVPLVALPTLDAVAVTASRDARLVVSVIDAKRGLSYAAVYRPEGGWPKRVSGYMCLGPEGIARAVMAAPGYNCDERGPQRGLVIAGDPPARLGGLLEADGARPVYSGGTFPGGREFLELSHRIMLEDGAGTAVSVTPMYLKKPV